MDTTNELPKAQKLLDDPLTGRMYTVTNPDTGADIDVFNFFGGSCTPKGVVIPGHDFKLKRNSSIEVDETIARAAVRVWGFLQAAPATKKGQAAPEAITVAPIANEAFHIPETLEFGKYQWPELKKIGVKAEIENVNKMNKPTLTAAIDNIPLNKLKEAVASAELELYLIKQ